MVLSRSPRVPHRPWFPHLEARRPFDRHVPSLSLGACRTIGGEGGSTGEQHAFVVGAEWVIWARA
jgi:hypothetical protein